MASAIAAAERARDLAAGIDVVVFERDDRVGRSILATGNGRCNFSNAHPYSDAYHNSSFVEMVFRNLLLAYCRDEDDRNSKLVFDNGSVAHAFFYKHGLTWREEDDGRQYPRTNKASTIVDILRASAASAGVCEACEREVKLVDVPRAAGKPFTLRMADGTLERADAVIVACGGRMLATLGLEELSRVDQRPLLGPLRVADSAIRIVRELDNIRVRCSICLVRGEDTGRPALPDKLGKAGLFDQGERSGRSGRVVAEETGELMFRKYGVSGVCVFNLSRFALPGDSLLVNFLGGGMVEDAKRLLFSRRKILASQFQNLTCSDMLRGLVLPRVADAVLKQAGLSSWRPFMKADVHALAEALVAFELEVAGIGDESLCQVRRGGLDVSGFNPRTMEACGIKGIYAAGEALDVDGPCGGYNLHWAWSSGLLAGISAAEALAI